MAFLSRYHEARHNRLRILISQRHGLDPQELIQREQDLRLRETELIYEENKVKKQKRKLKKDRRLVKQQIEVLARKRMELQSE